MFEVSLFGGFQIKYKDAVLNEDAIRSEMIVRLLSYLVMHRDHELTVAELTEALWSQDETENPAGALKNLMYRLRGMLKKTFGDEPYILTNRGAYGWNPEFPILVDAEEFEKNCSVAKLKSTTKNKKIAAYEEAIRLYQGDFLFKYADMQWIVPLTTYYHSMFLTGIKNLAELYAQVKRYEDMEKICAQALNYDTVDEQIHYLMIKSLIYQNKFDLAMEHYKKAEKVLYTALGVSGSSKLKEVHDELMKMKKTADAVELHEVYEDMEEDCDPDGAYVCGYPVFREIYRLEARKITRLGLSEYVLLATLSISEGQKATVQMKKFILTKAMDILEKTIKESLRIGDVAARFSDTQFVVLLPTCSFEAAQMIAERITIKMREYLEGKRVTITSDIEAISIKEPFKGRV